MKVYFDNAATTSVDEEIFDDAKRFCRDFFYNPSSLYDDAQRVRLEIDSVRKKIAKQINCEEEEILFTSGATEANNFALFGLAKANPTKKHIITSKIEHVSVLEACKVLEKEGYDVDYIGVNEEGIIDVQEVVRKIRSDTLVVSIMHVNNEVGSIQPIEEIGEVCLKKNVYFHSDCVQSFTKFPLDVKKMNIAMMSVSGHKVHAPKGIGFLYVRLGTKIKPLHVGGSHEFKLRAGTENVFGIYCLGKVLDVDVKNETVKEIHDFLVQELSMIKDSMVHCSEGSPYILNVSFGRIEGDALLRRLAKEGVFVSTGSACSSLQLEESHVLSAMHIDELYIHGSIRLSFCRESTMEEAHFALEKIKMCVESLREISLFSKK